MFCSNCGKELQDDAIRCTHCGNFVDAVKGKTSTNLSDDSKKSTAVFKFWSMHPITIIAVVLWIIIIIISPFDFFSWFYACISVFIGYHIAKEWAPRINGSQSWAFAIGFFFGIFGLIGYWLYYRHKLDNLDLQIPQQKREGEVYNHDAKYFKYWYNKGVEFSESNKYENALQAYNQALVFGDKDPDIWNNKCYVLFKLGWYEEAINAGKIGVNLAPNDHVIWENLRNAYLANNNPEKAAECNNKISNSQTGSAEKKSTSDNYRKPIDLIFVLKICSGLFVALLLFITINNYWQTIAKNTSSFLHGIVFIILLIGILYEGWIAITQ